MFGIYINDVTCLAAKSIASYSGKSRHPRVHMIQTYGELSQGPRRRVSLRVGCRGLIKFQQDAFVCRNLKMIGVWEEDVVLDGETED